MDTPGTSTAPQQRLPRWVRAIGASLAVLLFAAAVAMVVRQREVVGAAVEAMAAQPPSRIACNLVVIAGSIVTNLILTGIVFSLLISRFGRVGRLEMQALMASSTLMNFLPMRPGLLGRVAYHRLRNQIAVAHSARTVIESMLMSVATAAYLACALALASDDARLLVIALAAPAPLLAACGLLHRSGRVLWWAFAIRFVEVVVGALRYWAAFDLIGAPIDADGAVSFACIAVVATMVPFFSNGLGLREWAIGLAAPLVTSYQLELGMTADLVIRAAELVVVSAAGAAGTAYLVRLRERA